MEVSFYFDFLKIKILFFIKKNIGIKLQKVVSNSSELINNLSDVI